jgi:protein-S-isoprenylcysteine O-methyltransferase Ste14
MNKVLPPTYFLLTLILIAALHIWLPVYRYVSFPLNLLGVVPLVLGVVLNIIADNGFKRHDTTVKPFEQSSALVTSFPFSMSRNPMYLGITLMLLGVAVLLGSISCLAPALIFPVVIDRIFISTEERMLAETFGSDWQQYRSEVRRWI